MKALLVWQSLSTESQQTQGQHLDSSDLNGNKASISIAGNISVNLAITSQNGCCETGLLRTRTLACDVLQKKNKQRGRAQLEKCATVAAGEKVIVRKPN